MNFKEGDFNPLMAPAVMAVNPDGEGFAIDFESDEPLQCPIDGSKPIEQCEACQ